MQHAWQLNVIDVAALARDQARVFRAQDARPQISDTHPL